MTLYGAVAFRSAMNKDVQLPDTSAYLLDNINCLLPRNRLDYIEHLRISSDDRSTAIKCAINWVYSSGLFPLDTDYYAAGAWAVIAHGLACRYNGLPTSDWIYERHKYRKISATLMEERLNRAFLQFPVAVDMIVASKASWWYWDMPLCADIVKNWSLCDEEDAAVYSEIANIIGQWASTRKVLSLAGIKGLIEEYDVFDDSSQELKITDKLKPYFCHPPSYCSLRIEALFDPTLASLIRYWPDVEAVYYFLYELKDFHRNAGCYHSHSEFLTGKVRKRFLQRNLTYQLNIVGYVLRNPECLEAGSPQELLEGVNKEFLKQLVESNEKKEMETFLASQTPTIADDTVEAIMEKVNKMRMV
ncbi:hypothetical protein M513_07096 [Trichuris suis]|uniref:Uncharacterized protein n=1 Tax=Trichuris suis TaxID=68888 RepID=A0A085M418_9BILA|nr:hypothetical protein M513_07096 [Trichuris suis]